MTAPREDYYAFITDARARYLVRSIDKQEAAEYGVPHADAVLTGKHGTLVTRIGRTGAQLRRIPGSGGEVGFRAKFWDGEGQPVMGYVAVRQDLMGDLRRSLT